MKKCKFCGEDFKPRNGKQKYCNSKCTTAYHNAARTAKYDCVCAVCDTEFKSTRPDAQVCSPRCSREVVSKKLRERNAGISPTIPDWIDKKDKWQEAIFLELWDMPDEILATTNIKDLDTMLGD